MAVEELHKALMSMDFGRTRYPHLETMKALGISRDVGYLFKLCNLVFSMSQSFAIYKDETCQFLATLRVNLYDDENVRELTDSVKARIINSFKSTVRELTDYVKAMKWKIKSLQGKGKGSSSITTTGPEILRGIGSLNPSTRHNVSIEPHRKSAVDPIQKKRRVGPDQGDESMRELGQETKSSTWQSYSMRTLGQEPDFHFHHPPNSVRNLSLHLQCPNTPEREWRLTHPPSSHKPEDI